MESALTCEKLSVVENSQNNFFPTALLREFGLRDTLGQGAIIL
jgi:hypothetical protein